MVVHTTRGGINRDDDDICGRPVSWPDGTTRSHDNGSGDGDDAAVPIGEVVWSMDCCFCCCCRNRWDG